jgi:hypothetical protein
VTSLQKIADPRSDDDHAGISDLATAHHAGRSPGLKPGAFRTTSRRCGLETRRRLVPLVYDALLLLFHQMATYNQPATDCRKNHSHFQRKRSTPKLRFATDGEKGDVERMTAKPMKCDLSKFFPNGLSKLRPVEAAIGVVGVTAPSVRGYGAPD